MLTADRTASDCQARHSDIQHDHKENRFPPSPHNHLSLERHHGTGHRFACKASSCDTLHTQEDSESIALHSFASLMSTSFFQCPSHESVMILHSGDSTLSVPTGLLRPVPRSPPLPLPRRL